MGQSRARSAPVLPLIAITGRRLPGSALPMFEDRYRVHEFDMFFAAFSRGVAAEGGLPVALPYEAAAGPVINRVDGLVVTGGQDVEPARWGGHPTCAVGPVDPERDAYEFELVESALGAGVPILGVCRGLQLVNVALGGSLVPDLDVRTLDHTAKGRATDEPAHAVETTAGSLARLLFGPELMVNSLHHQAAAEPGEGVEITGRAPDGTAEIIEVPGRPVLGVQWHPEWMSAPDGSFRWLVGAANDYALDRAGQRTSSSPHQRPVLPARPRPTSTPDERVADEQSRLAGSGRSHVHLGHGRHSEDVQ